MLQFQLSVLQRSGPLSTCMLCPGPDKPAGKGGKAAPAKAAPILDPQTGEVKEPAKDERSFLQKNW